MKKLVSIALCLMMLMSVSLAATIESTGTGSVSLSPDTCKLSLGVRFFGSDVTEAMADVNRRVDEIASSLKELGIPGEGVTAEDVYIYNNLDYSSGENTGYNVSRQIQVTVTDVAKVGEAIDAALKAGADELNGLTYTSTLQRGKYDEAMAEAVKDARRRAEVIAAAEGMQLKGLVSLKENDQWAGSRFEDAGNADAATELTVGSIDVQASITAVYEAE